MKHLVVLKFYSADEDGDYREPLMLHELYTGDDLACAERVYEAASKSAELTDETQTHSA